MGWNYRRRIKVAPGVHLNVGKMPTAIESLAAIPNATVEQLAELTEADMPDMEWAGGPSGYLMFGEC